MIITDQDIGGARIVRSFSRGDEMLNRGDYLSEEEVRQIPIANRRALSDAGYIEIYPKAASSVKGERFIVGVPHVKSKFNVIEGRVLNSEPISYDEAQIIMKQP